MHTLSVGCMVLFSRIVHLLLPCVIPVKEFLGSSPAAGCWEWHFSFPPLACQGSVPSWGCLALPFRPFPLLFVHWSTPSTCKCSLCLVEEERTLWAKPGSQMIKESSVLPRSSKPKLKCFLSLAHVQRHQFTPGKMAAKSVFLPVATCSKSKQIRHKIPQVTKLLSWLYFSCEAGDVSDSKASWFEFPCGGKYQITLGDYSGRFHLLKVSYGGS